MSGDAAPAARSLLTPVTWYSWLLAGVYVYFLNMQGNVVPFLQSQFGLSYSEVSLHSSAVAVGVILTGFFAERLTARVGRRTTLRIAIAGMVAGGSLLCLSPAPWASIGSYFIVGCSGSLIPAVAFALLADLHRERRGEAFAGLSIVAYGFGLAMPLIFGFWLWQGFGWRAAVMTGAVLAIVIVLSFWRTPIAESRSAGGRAGGVLPPAYWAYWVLLFASCAMEFSVLVWAPAFLERVIKLEPATAATAAAGFPLGMLLGRIALGALARRVAPQTILFAALAIAAVGFVVYWGFSHPVASVAGLFILGLGIAPLFPLANTFALGSALDATDLASVRLVIAFGLSLLLAPFALGALADTVGFSLAHLALPALIVLAGVSFMTATALEKRTAAARS